MAKRTRERLDLSQLGLDFNTSAAQVEEEVPARPVQNAKRLMDNCVVLDLTFHRMGIRRKADMGQVETEADKSMLGLTKAIVDSKEYQDIVHLANEVRTYIAKRSLPSPLKRGTFLVSLSAVEGLMAKVDEYEAKYQELADKFVAVYPAKIKDAEERLGPSQFRADNYPSVKSARASFSIERRLLDFGVPSKKKIGLELWKQEREKAEAMWKDAAVEVQFALRESLRALVAHLADKLEPKPDGSRKTLYSSAITNVTEFLDLFQSRNVTGDVELEGLVAQARNVLKGKKADTLRTNAMARGKVAGEMARVMGALDQLLEKAPRRKIQFKEED